MTTQNTVTAQALAKSLKIKPKHFRRLLRTNKLEGLSSTEGRWTFTKANAQKVKAKLAA